MTKQKLLTLLEQNRGRNISGEFIAGEIGVSRAAIWKAVKELEKDGHKIAAATRSGYRLEEHSDVLSAAGILACFPDSALRGFAPEPPRGGAMPPLDPQQETAHCAVSENLHIYPSTDSTNILAKQAAIAGAEHFTVIMADEQTAGKGRYGKSFASPAGCGIYMSFVLRPPEIRLEMPTLVTAFAAVAVCEAIEAVCEKSPKIKWVNDIFLNNRKICGISNEAGTDFESGEISWIVTGIGVNFREPPGGFPDEIKGIAGAIFADECPQISRNRLAAEIITRMQGLNVRNFPAESPSVSHLPPREEYLGVGISNTPPDFLEKYRARLMYLGEKITIHEAGGAGEPYEATALNIDNIGRLIVRTNTGEELALSSGEVSVRGLNSERPLESEQGA
ncbi:MAG: biotin--[acetyl-CoA-carboxylase] ligase [Defluviitaleaceae bacterium]|nr:biotin--[acetyl-CoA-carboxylase] ligase [Defluviitaleaceae bacterium]